MDAKDLRTETAVSERNNDGSKYSQSGGIALHCDRNKSYQDIGSNSLGKVDVPNARPCAVIGPDRIVPPPAVSEAYHLKKGLAEPWPCMDNAYRRPPEYPLKLSSFQNPSRNISPRQTFQENMQRIMVPPSYNSIKINDDTNYTQIDRSNGLSKNIKLNMPPEAKFCDVPYAINPTNNEQKNVRNPEMCLPNVNPTLARTAPHGWQPGSVNLRSTRIYGAPELYQYQEYPSCAGPRPAAPRPHRTVQEEQGYVYGDPYYQEGNIRFKPYPSVKERYPQQRYEYIGNYSNPFHPPPTFAPHKYDLQKSMPPHPYPPYPPIKYVDSRVAEPVMEGYQRSPQGNYNMPYRNQVIHPNYGPVLGNCPQNKMHSYPPDAHIKPIPPNKVPYDNNPKAYIEYESTRPKIYPPNESYFVNEMSRMPMKSQVIMPNYPTLNMHNMPPNPYYKKDNPIKNYDHMAHFRNMDHNLNIHNSMSRHPPVFSPNTLAISPTDSSTSNDTTQTLGNSQEDCGYVSQSSNASVRSMDSSMNRIPNDCLRKYYDNRYGPIIRTSPMMSKSQLNSSINISKDKKQIDVRQFLQMWNEGDEEAEENSSKEIIIQTSSSEKNHFGKTHEAMNNQEQLYVLGLVNVPSEELAKYEHIQKVSKLPENIKGYNSIELLNQFEEVIESSNMNYKSPIPKEFQMSMKGVPKQATGAIPPRPVSPLDVEAKISQSVIHKEVGCNFEIKPCSPKMLNVEVAAPVQNILAERAIEKVANPIMIKSPLVNGINDNIDCNILKRPDQRLNINDSVKIPSCKMINTQFSNNNTIDPIKSSYSLQDLESNSGLCLASLPRLDNDIELNFPEVNQQFINANKGDSTVLTSLRDLPTLEILDQTDNHTQERLNSSGRENNISKSPYFVDSEKEVTKLSKYRKNKITTAEPKENQTQHFVSAVRTDSVIIKNPENIKNCGETLDFSSNTISKVITDIQQAPINLTSQGNSTNIESEPVSINMLNEENQVPVEIAIDFSVNKTCILENTKFTDTKIGSEIENPIHIHEDASNTSLIVSDQKENLNCENYMEPVQDTSKDTNNDITNSNETQPHNDVYVDIVSEQDKHHTSDVNNTEEKTTNINTQSISSENVEISSSEIFNDDVICKSDNYLMEVEKCHVKSDELPEEDETCTFTETDKEIQQNYDEDLQKENSLIEYTNKNTTPSVAIVKEFCDGGDESSDPDLTNVLIEPSQNEAQIEISTLENESNDMDDSMLTDKQQSQNVDCNNFNLTNEEKIDMNCDQSGSIKADDISSTVSNAFMITTNVNDNDAVNSTSHSLEELSSQERELKDLEKKYCPVTHEISSQENTDHCCLQNSRQIEDLKEKCEMPVRRYLWYGSKEVYSPWIQKLLMFTEGNINNVTTNRVNENEDNLVAATDIIQISERNQITGNEYLLDDLEKVYTTSKNDRKGSDNRFLESTSLTEIESLETVPPENAAVTLQKENVEKADEELIDANVSCTVFDANINEPVSLYDHSVMENRLEIDKNICNNEENIATVDVDISNTESVILEESTEPLKNDTGNPTLELGSNKDEYINDNFHTPTRSPTVNDFPSNIENQREDKSFNLNNTLCESPREVTKPYYEQPHGKNSAIESSSLFENFPFSCNKVQANVLCKKTQTLKRSLSDSALNMYNNDEQSKQEKEENVQFIWPFKRRKVNNVENDYLAQKLCNIIHSNRRNSISSIYNEENVSFCILIDNSCIITEEENEEQEKMCYTELSEDCLTEIETSCLKHDENIETLTEVISSPQQDTACDYSDSFAMECEEEKTLEESWVEDVACVETVISDDIAEDIEISGPTSPKDDVSSDNEESGVFSSSEHTDKVKYIYGNKMCNDDAQFVEILYNTPQMDVNKTLYNRESSRISEEYDRYYDNDSLEKMLSESNEPELPIYVPEYLNSIFTSSVANSKETSENFDIEPFSPFHNKTLDTVADVNVRKLEDENTHSIEILPKTQDDTIHSCESSVDNVFTYKQNDENTIYTSSSSPEVSSTTSEEKNSAILLKITNYKGSRISQINDISAVNKRSSCKFTEDKEYLQSQPNFPTNRPLLTKAAQKYIPPLKESIRDLKVKLSLPQHSLMKLKQLKISKHEPKINKQTVTVPRTLKKPKPKFEDVLKSIDEIQIKMHKEKTKKGKKSIPKVVIKKSENGSHYASTSNKDDFNPDLTGRKWQPWVFIEKNHFIDKMATKKKIKAVYSHRKRTYVLAEKFQKYKSASSAKFVISPPISDNASTGLKYTIRLKHTY